MKRQRHWPANVERKVLPLVMRRDNYECQIRGPYCTGVATCIDHIHPKAWGGGVDPSNLRAACKPCNLHKGARSDAQQPALFFRGATYRTAPLRKIPPLTSPWTPVVADYSRKPSDT